ncbi:hypothetical protein GWI33_014425 [Rhynchophorus ferrugineus]|uniref:Ig-like domain-containing protein n=1 Tax=Rhynchophorus ferrugineus TaxID=354439 RepID=A0A834M933_RHYFE|nr:hypothetical protein GWI33_014425 [Rhynchophorus ferrugineus]
MVQNRVRTIILTKITSSTSSTQKVLSFPIVSEAVAEISGSPDLHIRAGSRMRIVCRLRHNTEPPDYVFWYHNQRMINHDQGVLVTADRTSSTLRIEDVDPSYSGNYTCYPSNATPAYANVHVLNATEGTFIIVLGDFVGT